MAWKVDGQPVPGVHEITVEGGALVFWGLSGRLGGVFFGPPTRLVRVVIGGRSVGQWSTFERERE